MSRKSKHELDAYGNLNWTVGNEDWLTCFDAIRTANGIEYHVIVDGAGFTDTLAHATVPATEEGIADILNLPFFYADVAYEKYADKQDQEEVIEETPEGPVAQFNPYRIDPADTQRTSDAWAAHLRSLLAEPAPEEEEEHDALSRGQP